MIDYVTAIGMAFPGVSVSCSGDPTVYANLVSSQQLPTEAEIIESWTGVVRNQRITELSELCEQFIMAGFISEAMGQPYFYDSEIVDQINLIGAYMMTHAGMAVPYAARNMSTGVKEYYVHDGQQMTQVLTDGALWKLFYLNKFHNKRQYLLSLTYPENSIEDIMAVTWDSVEAIPDGSTIE